MIHLKIQKKLTAASGEMLLDIDTHIKKGSLVTLYGKSGVGKTTILRALGGLTKPDKGEIIVNGTTWFDSNQKINLKPQ